MVHSDDSSLFDDDQSVVAPSQFGTDVDVGGTKDLELEERKNIARMESKAVACWRIVVYLVVLAVALSVSSAVYLYTKNDQREDFETTFAAYAGIVTNSFFDSIQGQFGTYQSLSTTITSFAGKFSSRQDSFHTLSSTLAC